MKETRISQKIIFLLVLLFLSVTTYIILTIRSSGCNVNDVERRYKLKFSNSSGCIWFYKSTPKIVIKKAKQYLEENGFSGDDIEYTFDKYRDWVDEKFTYTFCVDQSYKRNINCKGYFEINLDGDIVSVNNLKLASELANVQTEPAIDTFDAIEIGRTYLNQKEIISNGVLKMIDTNPNTNKLRYVYDVRYDNQKYSLYIDAITGEVIKKMEGTEVIRDKYFE